MGLMEPGCKLEDFGRLAQPAATNRLRCRVNLVSERYRHYHWPETCHAVWRMARLESRRRARQAAIPPRVSACSLRTEDTQMRLLTELARVRCSFTEREPPERKHLSRGRKRNQHGIPLVAASELGIVQTESHKETYGRCRVKGPAASSLVKLK